MVEQGDRFIQMNEIKESMCKRLMLMNEDYMRTVIYAMSSSTLASLITYLYSKYKLKKNTEISTFRATSALLSVMFAVYIGRYATGPRYFGKRLKRRRSKRVSKKHY